MSAVGFPNSVAELGREKTHWVLCLFISSALLLLWGAWMFLSELTVYITTSDARLEVAKIVHPVEVPFQGQVAESNLELGKIVHQGEILLVLDSLEQRLQLKETEESVHASEEELAALEKIIEYEAQIVAQMKKAAKLAVAESAAQIAQAETEADFAIEKSDRYHGLKEQGRVPELEILSAESDAKKRQLAARTRRLAYRKMLVDKEIQIQERELGLKELKQRASKQRGEIRASKISIERLKASIERRTLRAPSSGRLGEIKDMPSGVVIPSGEKVASVVPEGSLRIVAFFLAKEALGRIRAGHRAKIKLDAFPWAQYGSIEGTVASVASEPDGGRLRTEIAVDSQWSEMIPYQHGLAGVVEVGVERTSPAMLVLRLAGGLMQRRASADQGDGKQMVSASDGQLNIAGGEL